MRNRIHVMVMSASLGVMLGIATGAAHGQEPGGAAPPHLTAEISWRVANPFPLFKTPRLVETYREALKAVGVPNPTVEQVARRLNDRSNRGWVADFFRLDDGRTHDQAEFTKAVQAETCWNIRDTRGIDTTTSGCPGFFTPSSHAVLASVKGGAITGGQSCLWTVNGNQDTAKTAPCDAEVALQIPYERGGAGAVASVRALGPDGAAPTHEASATIKVRDLLVVGLGDSFGSGEGNPDLPALMDSKKVQPVHIEQVDHAFPVSKDILFPARAKGQADGSVWLDRICHRSFHSPQFMAALHLAATSTDVSVAFLGLACSGAEIDQGVLEAYGGVERAKVPANVSLRTESQIAGARRMLCQTPDARGNCPQGAPLKRHADLIYLSIGGNDIGFANLVGYTLLNPGLGLAVFELRNHLGHKVNNPEEANEIINGPPPGEAPNRHHWLGDKYAWLAESLKELAPDSRRVILTSYPVPLSNSLGRLCGSDPAVEGGSGDQSNVGMEVFLPLLNMAYDAERAGEVMVSVSLLRDRMKGIKDKWGWSWADAHEARFQTHGWCAASPGEELRIPTKANSVWSPYNPASFRPYASRQRWFRTPDDAYMIVNNLPGGSGALGIAGPALSGAMHPTAEGHSVVADALLAESRRLLDVK